MSTVFPDFLCVAVEKFKKCLTECGFCAILFPLCSIGVSPSGKAQDFDSCSRRFKSGHPSHVVWSKSIRTRKQEKTGDFERFLPFFRPCIFSEFHRSLLLFSMLCLDSNRRNAFFDIDSPQSQNRGQIRTATHFPKPFKNPSHSKFIYKATDAKHIDKFRLL